MANVHIVDDMMGRGKSTGAINYINSSPDDKRFMYVTPYNDEARIIKQKCARKHFITTALSPEQEATRKKKGGTPKIIRLKAHLKKGDNVVITHSLFHYFDDEAIEYCRQWGYELIMDEVAEVIAPYKCTKGDRDIILNQLVKLNDDGTTELRPDFKTYKGRFNDLKSLVKAHRIVVEKKNLLELFPIEVFEAFSQTFILTYMFDAQFQRYYYDMFGIKYDYYHIEKDEQGESIFVPGRSYAKSDVDYSKLIHIVEDRRINSIGDDDNALSKRWYQNYLGDQEKKEKDDSGEKGCDDEHRAEKITKEAETLRNDLYNFFKNKSRVIEEDGRSRVARSSECLWTTYSGWKDFVGQGCRARRGFLACNARASNQWGDRIFVAYLVNRFMNPNIEQFFNKRGIKVSKEGFALSEMLQFIWRSAIRYKKPITVYIPSRRMRNLLKKWIKENSPEEKQ